MNVPLARLKADDCRKNSRLMGRKLLCNFFVGIIGRNVNSIFFRKSKIGGIVEWYSVFKQTINRKSQPVFETLAVGDATKNILVGLHPIIAISERANGVDKGRHFTVFIKL